MAKQQLVKSAGAVLAASVMAIACGASTPPVVPKPAVVATKDAAAPAHAEVHERVVPHTCGTRAKVAQMLGYSAPAAPPPADQSAASAPPPTSVGANARLAGNQAYRVVAPATVLIRTEHGMGTGVVIDPAGYILTNYHVVSDGQQKDFVLRVDVSFGDLTPTGRMARQEKSYEGVVVKADPVRDMAIVRVKDAPPKLTAIKLAKSAPQIAEKVISVGHAGIGFLWAAKTCNIASIGERQQDASILAGLDCTRADPTASPEAAAARKKSCDAQKKQMTESFLAKTQGLAVQTDCAITHGDSGGPLVNAAGEMVGLNQSISADLATASFHVHLDEVRDFVAKHGEEGVAILPDPFCDGGLDTSLEDLDFDGVPDTLVTKGTAGLLGAYDRMALLIDLDQDHFKRENKPLEPFDAEIALLTIRDTAYVWYDTDGDSRFDVLLVDKGNDGTPDLAYRIDAEGRPKADKELVPKHDLSSKLVTDTALRARLGKIGVAIGGAKYTSRRALAAASRAGTIPELSLGAGMQGRLVDTDDNGKPDVLLVRGTFTRGLVIDANEKSLGSLAPGDATAEMLKGKNLDAELSVVAQGNSIWATYDTDSDGKIDLALMTTNGTDQGWLFATSAWKVGAGGEMTPAPEQLGRKLLRPGLVPFPRVATALKGTGFDMAADEALGSLPDPHSPKGDFRFRELKGVAKGAIIEAQSLTSTAVLVDLDRTTTLPPNADPEKLVNDGKFFAEIAFVTRGGFEWIYYDTDGDHKFDLVLFVSTPGKDPAQAYRIVKSASAKGGFALEVDSAAAAGRPIRHKSVFKDKRLAATWKDIASKMFKASAIEP